jgi:hypothetical protein
VGEKGATASKDRKPKREFRDAFRIGRAAVEKPDPARQERFRLMTGERQGHDADHGKTWKLVQDIRGQRG